jgi:hypothetical protein
MKNLLLTLFIVSACNSSFGQNETTSTTSNETAFYFKAGANLPFFTGEKAKWEGKPSYHIGVGIDVSLNEKISLSPELIYYRMFAEPGNEIAITGNDELTISFISIPLLAKYKFTNKLAGELGPQMLYISHVERTRNWGIENEKPNRRVKDFDFGVTAGLSYFFTNKLGVNARYYLGLTEVDEYPGTYTAYTSSDLGKISFASLSLVYKL